MGLEPKSGSCALTPFSSTGIHIQIGLPAHSALARAAEWDLRMRRPTFPISALVAAGIKWSESIPSAQGGLGCTFLLPVHVEVVFSFLLTAKGGKETKALMLGYNAFVITSIPMLVTDRFKPWQ